MGFQAPQRPWLPRRPVIVGDHLFERGSGDVHAHVYPATAQVTGEIALAAPQDVDAAVQAARAARSEEHTSELQSLMRISYAVFCLKKKKTQTKYLTSLIQEAMLQK